MLLSKYINKYYLRHAPALLFGILMLVMVDYIQLIIPEKYQLLINGVNDGTVLLNGVAVPFDGELLLNEICMPLVLIILGLTVGRFLWRLSFIGTSLKVEASLRSEMFDRCKGLSQQFYHTNKVGNLMSLFTNDLETIQDCFAFGVLMTADSLFLGILAMVKMMNMNRVLTLYSLIPMVFLLGGAIILGKSMEKKWDTRQAAFSKLSDFSQESFSGIAVIKAFVKGGIELSRFKKLNKENEDANVAYTKYSVAFNIFVTLFVESVICIILGYGGYLVHEGIFNAGQLVEFIAYFNAIIWPIMAISQLIEMTSRGNASLKRVGELLDETPDVKDRENADEIKSLKGEIEFKNLTFTYPGRETPVLHDINLKINAGENVGIIGGTGSGKSTLVDLLTRTYTVADNSLFVDSRDVNSITVKSLRNFVAYVPQDVFLFSESIEDNIKFSDERVTKEDIQKAASDAGVKDDIEGFTDKYKTVLGERGVTLSGGQKQRVSIARALTRNCPVLILDDSVSAVDVSTEQEILEKLKNARKGMTTIFVAHRISTIENMDKIVYMENGRIVDCARHGELFKRCEGYRREVLLQRLESGNKEEEL